MAVTQFAPSSPCPGSEDEGPIIAQGVISGNHSHPPDDLVKLGRDIEASLLANALKAVVEHRVLLNEAKTVVF